MSAWNRSEALRQTLEMEKVQAYYSIEADQPFERPLCCVGLEQRTPLVLPERQEE